MCNIDVAAEQRGRKLAETHPSMLYKEEKFDRSYIDDHLTLDMHVANGMIQLCALSIWWWRWNVFFYFANNAHGLAFMYVLGEIAKTQCFMHVLPCQHIITFL